MMTNHKTELVTATPSTMQSSVPPGLAITYDVRMRQAQAEMLSRYQLAVMLPRQWESVCAKLLLACDNPDFAREAYYSKPAGRDNIEGLSIRFAEEAQRLMRNISVECAPEMEDELSVHYRMTVTDLESNTPESETFKVDKSVERHSYQEGTTVLSTRTNSSGKLVYLIPATEDQINTKLRAQKAKVKRSLILSILPADVKVQCLARCKVVANGDLKDPAAAAKSIVMAFISIGIDVPDLKEYLGKSPANATAKEVEALRGIFALVREGELTWGDIMAAKREREEEQGSKAAFVAQKQKERESNKARNKPPAAARVPRGSSKAAGGAPAGAPAGAAAAGSGGGAAATETAKPARASRRGDDEEEGDDNAPASSGPSSSNPAS